MSTPDVNLYDTKDNEVVYRQNFDGNGYSDAVKCSNKTNVVISECHIIGGSEDCIDINRGSNINVYQTVLKPTGNFAMTIKGGASKVMVQAMLKTHGKECDIDLGNWSDQSQEKCKNITLNVTAINGESVTVRVLNSDKPHLMQGSGPYKFLFPNPNSWYHSLAVKTFMFLRKQAGLFK